MTEVINNGKRVFFSHASAAGIGGLSTRAGRIEYSYPTNNRPIPSAGTEIHLDGTRYRVITVSQPPATRRAKLGLQLLQD